MHVFRISFEEKMYVVHQFMFENKLGKGLLQRVDHYFTLLWDQFRSATCIPTLISAAVI